MDFSLMSLGLAVLLGGFLIGEGETDDGTIATSENEVGWIGKNEAIGTYINVRVSWVDIDVEVSWTAPSAVSSELRSIEMLDDVQVLSLVDCWQSKVLIFSISTGCVFKLFA